MPDLLCVCGAGTMGSGIAETAALHGISVILYDLDPSVLSKASGQIETDLQQLAEKRRISALEKNGILERIRFTGDLAECRAGIILEAIVEQTEAKSALFTGLEKINAPETLFASNSSSLSIKTIAEQTSFPERIVGMHFFNPAPRMKLVEIIRTTHLAETSIQRIRDLAIRMGKTPVICEDAPGFIVNHVARPFYLEALRLVEHDVADVETVDRLAEAAGFKMGPFRLMDLIGNDVNYTVSCSLYNALGMPARLKPSPLQKLKVEQGALGRKTGSGFFEYSG
ncbi:MAG: 3-hydroxyacyl-CoA dehydrogenase NAD-binding domain-containing protein [Bacteroidota bacterium]|nr:3-hydroxyacyl-CoA dehydrogenase NAD-binding domain-containing protein [Bacteroidota bacterium]